MLNLKKLNTNQKLEALRKRLLLKKRVGVLNSGFDWKLYQGLKTILA